MGVETRILRRQKVLLAAIDALSERKLLSKTAIMKALFLAKYESSLGKQMSFYDFFPYKYGPYSQLCYYDLNRLAANGLIREDSLQLTDLGRTIVKESDLARTARTLILSLIARFNSVKELVEYVYYTYPEYTILSERCGHCQRAERPGIYTVGYEGRTIDAFLNILIRNNVSVVFDVRKYAFSRNPFFRKSLLESYLHRVGIDYIHISELGVDRKIRMRLKNSGDYRWFFSVYRKHMQANLKYVLQIMMEGTKRGVAIMCMEKNPNICHRKEIGDYIREQGCAVVDL